MNEIRNDSNCSTFHVDLLHTVSAGRRLAKVPLCLLIACSTAFGASLAPGSSLPSGWAVSAGVFLLAMGAATLNSLQEVASDSLMQRTKNRPLVRGELSVKFAALQTGLLICSGLVILQLASISGVSPGLGFVALLLYNGFYTPLKKVTLYALVPGAICGAIPPLIGLAAMGGELLSHQALLLFALLILWQIPHFFLVQLQHKHDYLASVQPSFLQKFSETGLRKLAVAWISSLGFVMLLFTISPMVESFRQCGLVGINAAVFTFMISRQLLLQKSRNYKMLFISLNTMLVFHMLILSF